MAKAREPIRQFQLCLQEIMGSNILPKYGADGKWGNETKNAMNSFQRAFGLSASAIPNTKTVEVINLQTPMNGPIDASKLINAVKAYIAEKAAEGEVSGEPSLPAEIPPGIIKQYGIGEKKGFPWWGWLVVGLGAAGVVGGGIYLYYRYKKKKRYKGYGELGDLGDLGEVDCPTCTSGGGEIKSFAGVRRKRRRPRRRSKRNRRSWNRS